MLQPKRTFLSVVQVLADGLRTGTITLRGEESLSSAKEKKGIKIQPLDDCVVVEPLETGETGGGLILADTAKQKPRRGRVLAVGPGKLLDNGQRAIATGDVVVYGQYAGSDIEVDRKEIKILRESDILGKVER